MIINYEFMKMLLKKFEIFWKGLLKELATPKKIKNWTAKKGHFGENFTAQVTSNPTTGGIILCTTVKGSENNASMEDFHMIYKNWEGYLSGRIPRKEFSKRSFVTKYTISIIHQFGES
jgi:hypothetical protein